MKSEEYCRISATRIKRGSDTIEDFQTTAGGRVFASSIDGGITGRRADVVIVDDPLAIKDAGNLSKMHRINEQFDKEIVTRLSDDEQGRIMVVMHRLHEEDLTGHLVKKGGWDCHAHPLIAERLIELRFDGLVWRREKGDQLRSGFYSEKRLRDLMDEEGKPSPGMLYQQGIGSEKDTAIAPTDFPLIDRCDVPRDLPVVFAIDCSQKQTPSSSRNVILVIVRLGNDDIVLHEFCKQSDYVELYEAFHILAKKYQPSAVLVEDACNGSALIAQLQHEREFHIVPVVPKGSKTKRLRRHVSHIKRRHIRLPNEAPWYGDFVGEFVSFPDSASDRIDALTMYLDFMESNPVLHAPRRRERASPAGVGSRGPIRLPALSSLMQARGAVLVTASSVQHGPSTMMERPAPISAPNDEITVIMATPDGVIRKKI